MKKSTFLFLLSLACLSFPVRSQIAFTVSPTQQCYTGSNSLFAMVTVTSVGVTSYTWQAVGTNTCVANVMASGLTATVNMLCVGNYSMYCTAYNGTTAVASAMQTFTINPLPVITATISTNASPACSGSSYTLNANGGVTYTVNGGFGIVPGMPFVPLGTSCYTVVGANFFGCQMGTVACLTVQPNPTITVVGPNSNCIGATTTLVAAGASSYTWIPGALNGPNIVVSPTVNTCYTVSGTSPSGCTSTAVHCITVGASPNVFAIATPSNVCLGNSTTLTAGGAINYTWVPGNFSGPTFVFTPTVSTSFTVTGSTGAACSATTSVVVIVNPVPQVSITAAPLTTICPGGSATLYATGGTTYSWSVGATTPSIVVTPTANTCYTVISSNANGCTGFAVYCVNVATLAPITFSWSSANGTLVCEGSSITYTANANGAVSYSWSGGSALASTTIIAGTFANYQNMTQTVTALFANGCLKTTTMTPWLQTATCSNVWPGDANRDGVVNNTDVFELGLANNATGPARTNPSITWVSQYATHWTGTVSTGWNRNHADCNGNGTINAADTAAIVANFGLTHTFKITGNSSANPDISLVVPINLIPGQWTKADIMLGDVSSPMSQVYGVAFDLSIDQNLLDNNQAYLVYTASFLDANNQNIVFRKNDLNNGTIYAASVRVDGNNVSGNGKIGEFWFKVSPAPNNPQINLSVGNAVKIGNSGLPLSINGGTASANILLDGSGVNESAGLGKHLALSPNPASNQLTLLNSSGAAVNYSIVDVLGRLVMKGEFVGTKTIDVSSLQQGAFFVRFESAGQTSFKKLVIEKR